MVLFIDYLYRILVTLRQLCRVLPQAARLVLTHNYHRDLVDINNVLQHHPNVTAQEWMRRTRKDWLNAEPDVDNHLRVIECNMLPEPLHPLSQR